MLRLETELIPNIKMHEAVVLYSYYHAIIESVNVRQLKKIIKMKKQIERRKYQHTFQYALMIREHKITQ